MVFVHPRRVAKDPNTQDARKRVIIPGNRDQTEKEVEVAQEGEIQQVIKCAHPRAALPFIVVFHCFR